MQEENVIMAGGHHGLEIRSPVYDNKGSYTDSQTALNPMPKASGNPWDQLGGRLALGRDDIDDLAAIGAADATGDAYELEGGPVRREDPEHRVVSPHPIVSTSRTKLKLCSPDCSSPNSNRRWTSTCSTPLLSCAS